MNFVLPSILVAAAIGLFVMYTNPTYQSSKAIQAQLTMYDDALTKSNELRQLRDQLLSKYNTFSDDNKTRLQESLPDNVDNIRLIIDINNIAAKHGLAVSNIQLGDVGGAKGARSAIASGATGSDVGSVTVGFSIKAPYDGFLSFTDDLQHSLRYLDIEKVSFKSDPLDNAVYTISLRTYWLH